MYKEPLFVTILSLNILSGLVIVGTTYKPKLRSYSNISDVVFRDETGFSFVCGLKPTRLH